MQAVDEGYFWAWQSIAQACNTIIGCNTVIGVNAGTEALNQGYVRSLMIKLETFPLCVWLNLRHFLCVYDQTWDISLCVWSHTYARTWGSDQGNRQCCQRTTKLIKYWSFRDGSWRSGPLGSLLQPKRGSSSRLLTLRLQSWHGERTVITLLFRWDPHMLSCLLLTKEFLPVLQNFPELPEDVHVLSLHQFD